MEMILLISTVFDFFLVLLGETFFRSETVFFLVRHFFVAVRRFYSVGPLLLSREFFFLLETFSFSMTLFLSARDSFSFFETFSLGARIFFSRENISTQSENFWSTIDEGVGKLWNLCLVL